MTSNMKELAPRINDRLAARVCELRARRGLSLDALAARSGVSRSMLSLVERGESSPTAVVLEKLAAGLGVTMPSLFDSPANGASGRPQLVAPRAEQQEWKDPASGYRRRNVSPPGVPQPMQIVEVHFPPRARVAFDAAPRTTRVYQQLWVLDGAIEVTVGEQRYPLRTGDCLAMELGSPTTFHNPTRKTTRYAVVIAAESDLRR